MTIVAQMLREREIIIMLVGVHASDFDFRILRTLVSFPIKKVNILSK